MFKPFRAYSRKALKNSARGFQKEIDRFDALRDDPTLSAGFRRSLAGWRGGASSDLGAARKELKRRRRANRKKRKK